MFEELLDIKNCVCGRDHLPLVTRDYIVEENALEKLPMLLEKHDLAAKPLAIFDNNTLRAAFHKLDRYLPGIDFLVLQGDEIHADEKQIEAITNALSDHSVLLAVGSGVICDVTSYVACQQYLPYIAVPTAASVDGFVSNSSAMTFKGAKTTLVTVAPVAVCADMEIVAAAPKYLTASGVGDMLSKYIAIADWHMGHFLTDEYFCPMVADLSIEAANMVVDQADGIAAGDPAAISKLMEGLLLSGISMQLVGITRPGSSFEHHFSHYLEVVPMPKNVNTSALHGEKVGIGTIAAATFYPAFTKQLKRIFLEHLPNKFSIERVKGYYSQYPAELVDAIEKENTPTITETLNVDLLEKNYGRALQVAAQVPAPQSLIQTLKKVGGYTHYSDIGMTRDQFREALRVCCYIRNRFTTLRVMCDYELFDFDTVDM